MVSVTIIVCFCNTKAATDRNRLDCVPGAFFFFLNKNRDQALVLATLESPGSE